MIVLTGGAGFIGSCFLKKLNRNGIDNILIVDNLASSLKWKNLIGKQFNRYIHKEKFREELNLGEFEGKIEAIFHLGACSTTTERNIDYLMDNNFDFSRELCDYAVRYSIPFHYASSAATYGMGENGYSDRKFEDLRPLNGYGFSKHVFDEWLIQQNWDSKVTGYKFFNVFGPNEYHKGSMASMVYKSFGQIKDNGFVKLFKSNDTRFEDGGQKRDFIYVKDVIEVMWYFYQNKVKGIYNLGTGKARNWNDLINAVFSALGEDPKIEYIEMPDSLKGQYQNFTEAEMDKFNAACTHKFEKLEDSVADYIQNYLIKDWKYL